jgi:hypothetical protein
MKLTQKEADQLINMLKQTVKNSRLNFPASKGKLSFDVVGERKIDMFVINIDRKGINAQSCTYQGRIKSNNLILLRLDVNPTAIHINPSGEKITGTHLHIYNEQYELSKAIAFDIEDKDLYDNCYTFFEEFHIIKPPKIEYQSSTIDKGGFNEYTRNDK